jgi:hypothetical protein
MRRDLRLSRMFHKCALSLPSDVMALQRHSKKAAHDVDGGCATPMKLRTSRTAFGGCRKDTASTVVNGPLVAAVCSVAGPDHFLCTKAVHDVELSDEFGAQGGGRFVQSRQSPIVEASVSRHVHRPGIRSRILEGHDFRPFGLPHQALSTLDDHITGARAPSAYLGRIGVPVCTENLNPNVLTMKSTQYVPKPAGWVKWVLRA